MLHIVARTSVDVVVTGPVESAERHMPEGSLPGESEVESVEVLSGIAKNVT